MSTTRSPPWWQPGVSCNSGAGRAGACQKEEKMNGYVSLIEARTDALEMVRAGVRLTYVGATTGLPERFLRELWREVHGKRPAGGRTYCDPRAGLRSSKQRQEAAAFANLYFAGSENLKSLEARRFIQAWQAFLEMLPGAALDSTLAWAVIRNICARLTWRETCGKCGVSFIRHDEQFGKHAKCPFCDQ